MISDRHRRLVDEALSLPESSRREFMDRLGEGERQAVEEELAIREESDVSHVGQVFRTYLEQHPDDKDQDFATLCESQDAIASDLRRYRAAWSVAQRFARMPFAERLRKEYGHDAAPDVDLDQEGEGDDPSTLERYQLKDPLGQGGMGVVLRVWDKDLRRHLAMKILSGEPSPRGTGSTLSVDAQRMRRFIEEAQITGQLDHPGVIPVHEVGFDKRGRAYFTMRLIKGKTFKEALADVKEGRNDWSLTRALNTLLRVCETMAFAHSRGVIHRDLKPTNIMVGRYGETYVVDWGLARVLGQADSRDPRPDLDPSRSITAIHTPRDDDDDSDMITMDGDIIGTPSYMSPEQARGESENIGTPSDVYAMGAILYHLLTHERPYQCYGERLTPIMIHAQVIQGAPPRVLERAPGAPVELVAICEKAMAREAADRYPSMIEMARDLRAYLENRVVKAYAQGPVIEFRKWFGRNRAFAASIAAGLLIAMGGLVALFMVTAQSNREIEFKNSELETRNALIENQARELEARQATLEEQKEDLQSQTEQLERQRSELDIKNQNLEKEAERTRAILEFLTDDLLSSVDPSASAGKDVTVREILESASSTIEGKLKDLPDVAAEIHFTLGETYRNLDRYVEADTHLQEALRLRTQHYGPNDEATINTLIELADLRRDQSFYDEARDYCREVLLRYGPRHAETKNGVYAQNALADVLQSLGYYNEALETIQVGIENAKRVYGEESSFYLSCFRILASIHRDLDNHDEAVRILEDLLEKQKRIFGEEFSGVLATMNRLASTILKLGQIEEAIALYEKVVEIERKKDANAAPRPVTLINLASAYEDAGRYEEAEELYQSATTSTEEKLGPDHRQTLVMKFNFGMMYVNLDRDGEAEALFDQSCEKFIRLMGEDHPDSITMMSQLAGLYSRTDRPELEAPLLVKMIDYGQIVYPNRDDIIGAYLRRQGDCLRRLERFDEAEESLIEAYDFLRDSVGKDDSLTRNCVEAFIDLYDAWGKPEEADMWRDERDD